MQTSSIAISAYETEAKKQARDALILDHLIYVKRVMRRFSGTLPISVDRENLESAGVVGLIEAADRFDPEKYDIPFEVYAYRRIYGAMIDELRKNSPLSQSMLKQITKLNGVYEKLEPPVAIEDLATAANMTVKQVEECLEAIRLTNPKSWDDLFCSVHSSWANVYETPDSRHDKKEVKEIVAAMIERLPDRQRAVLSMYYHEELKMAEIGEVIGVSEGRISRILSAATFRLKELVRAKLS